MKWVKCYTTFLAAMLAIMATAQPYSSFDGARALAANTPVTDAVCAAQDYYFKTLTAAPGTLQIIIEATNNGAESGTLTVAGYDGRRSTGLLGQKQWGGGTIAAGALVKDTLYFYGQLADSFFLQLSATQCFGYTVAYSILDSPGTDAEPNNVYTQAQSLLVAHAVSGNVGYYRRGVQDAEDYFKITLPATGSMKLPFTVINRGTAPGQLRLYFYKARKCEEILVGMGPAGSRSDEEPVEMGQRFLGGTNPLAPGVLTQDTFTISCTECEEVFVRLSSTTPFAYNFNSEFISRVPQVKIAYERLGNEFGFRAITQNTTSYTWYFETDGFTSTQKMPRRVLPIGQHTIHVNARNSFCTKEQSNDLVTIDVPGVEKYTPNRSATGGEGILTIYGGALNSNTKITLKRGTTLLSPKALHGNSYNNKLTAEFDFHFALPGVYDVEIEIEGEEPVLYPNGFTITGFEYPYTSAKIIAPDIWRAGLNRTFYLSIENHGNATATGVRVGLVWPKSLELNFRNIFQWPRTGVDSVPNGSGGWYTVPRSALSPVYDEVNTTTEISVFQGQPYDGYIRYFYVPHVPANSSVEIPVTARSAGNNTHLLKVFTLQPNLFGSCGNEAQADLEDLMQAELLDFADDFADATKVPPFKLFVKTAKVGSKHMGSASSYFGKKFWAWYDGYEFDADAAMADLMHETEINNQYAVETLVKEVADLAGSKAIGKVKDAVGTRVSHINKRLAANPNMSTETFDKYLDLLNSTSDQGKRVELLEKMFTGTKDFDKMLRRAQSLEQLAIDCPELAQQIEELKKNADNEFNHRNTNDKKTESNTSYDPNAIWGPSGYNTFKYVNNTDLQHFIIGFENVDTARADAQVVVIRDTLDKNVFDLGSFELGDITIGDTLIRMPAGRQQVMMQRQLSPTMDVRINARLDTATGEALWVFTAIDRATEDVPELAGFLPPNITKPAGEGYVMYKLKPKPNLPHLTPMRSKASIYFDQNEPIVTNTWQNIIDLAPPTTSLTATRIGDTTIRIHISGADAHAGLGSFNVYVRQNGKDWMRLSQQAGDTLLFEGRPDSTYSFYAEGIDSLRNAEAKTASAEATITLDSSMLPVRFTAFSGRALQTTNQLYWSTATETNNHGFYVERSTDGQKFTDAGFVASQAMGGNSHTRLTYHFADTNPATVTYYRLRQVDKDGTPTQSKTIWINRNAAGSNLVVAPNPASRYFTLQSPQPISQLRLLDMQGRLIQAFVPNAESRYTLPPLPAGLYLLVITHAQGTHTQRLHIMQ